jgi:hypothetical protein
MVEWEVDRHLTFVGVYSHFFPGAFLVQPGLEADVDFVAVWAAYKLQASFLRQKPGPAGRPSLPAMCSPKKAEVRASFPERRRSTLHGRDNLNQRAAASSGSGRGGGIWRPGREWRSWLWFRRPDAGRFRRRVAQRFGNDACPAFVTLSGKSRENNPRRGWHAE